MLYAQIATRRPARKTATKRTVSEVERKLAEARQLESAIRKTRKLPNSRNKDIRIRQQQRELAVLYNQLDPARPRRIESQQVDADERSLLQKRARIAKIERLIKEQEAKGPSLDFLSVPLRKELSILYDQVDVDRPRREAVTIQRREFEKSISERNRLQRELDQLRAKGQSNTFDFHEKRQELESLKKQSNPSNIFGVENVRVLTNHGPIRVAIKGWNSFPIGKQRELLRAISHQYTLEENRNRVNTKPESTPYDNAPLPTGILEEAARILDERVASDPNLGAAFLMRDAYFASNPKFEVYKNGFRTAKNLSKHGAKYARSNGFAFDDRTTAGSIANGVLLDGVGDSLSQFEDSFTVGLKPSDVVASGLGVGSMFVPGGGGAGTKFASTLSKTMAKETGERGLKQAMRIGIQAAGKELVTDASKKMAKAYRVAGEPVRFAQTVSQKGLNTAASEAIARVINGSPRSRSVLGAVEKSDSRNFKLIPEGAHSIEVVLPNSGKVYKPQEFELHVRAPGKDTNYDLSSNSRLAMGVPIHEWKSPFKERVMASLKSLDPKIIKSDPGNKNVKSLADNLVSLHNATLPEVRSVSQNWFEGANRISIDLARVHGISPAQSAAILSVFSSSTGWEQNVSRADRTLDILARKGNSVWDDSMTAFAASKREYYPNEVLRRLIGRRLKDLETPQLKARWIRAYDEAHNPRHYRHQLPNGQSGNYMTNQDGALSKLQWGNFGQIERAVRVWEDGAIRSIDAALGRHPKTRSLYNAIFVPESPFGYVPVDRHLVNGAHLANATASRRFLGNVQGNWNNNLIDLFQGHLGTNIVYDAATRNAAKQLGILPQQVHGVIWNSVRDLFGNMSKNDRHLAHQIIKESNVDFTLRLEKLLKMGGGNPPKWKDQLGDATHGRSSFGDRMRLTDLGGKSANGRPKPKPIDILEMLLNVKRMEEALSRSHGKDDEGDNQTMLNLVQSYILGRLVKRASLATRFRYIE